MSFSRIRFPGAWTLNSTVDPSEWEAFDDHQSKAIDGFGGGVYAPTSIIEIGGEGLQVSGQFIVAGGGAIAQIDLLSVTGLALFQNLTVDNGTLHIEEDADLDCDGGATFSAGIAVDGTGVIANHIISSLTLGTSGDATVGGTLGVSGLTTLGSLLCGPSIMGGAMQMNEKLQLNSHGRLQFRVVLATDANATYQVQDYDAVWLPAATLTAGRTWTIGDTGAEDGMIMDLSRAADVSGNTVLVKRTDTSTIFGMTAGESCRIIRAAGAWQVLHQVNV